MGQRLNYEQLEGIKKKLGVNKLYSFSRVNLFKTDAYGYFLRYIKKAKEDRNDSVYGLFGNKMHDLTEERHLDEITNEEMLEEYNDYTSEMEILGFKFDRNDENKNSNISNKYHACNRHFIENFTKMEGENFEIEKPISLTVGKYGFFGYVDYKYETLQPLETLDSKDNETRILSIIDLKTSSIYKGKKIDKEKSQLLLYAYAFIQKGWHVDNVKIAWNFTKYISVEVQQKNGKVKTRQIERNEIGSKLSASAKTWLKNTKRYSDEEINDFIVQCVVENNIDGLPEDVKDKFVISDCFIYIDINQEEIDGLIYDFSSTVTKMNELEKEYNETGDDTLFWTDIDRSNEYFFATLSGYSRKIHKPFNAYLLGKENRTDMLQVSLNKPKSEVDDEEDFDIDSLLAELEE